MNAKEGDELGQLEESLAGMEYLLQTHYIEIGKSVLELAFHEQKAIDAIVDDIIVTRKKIAKERREIRCSGCMALCSETSSYCGRCGAPLKIQKAEENSHENEE